MKFWTCGPFKELEDRREETNFRIQQQALFQSILQELADAEELYKNGSTDEMLLAAMMIPELENKLHTILGIQNDVGQTESHEVLRETILKSISGFAKE